MNGAGVSLVDIENADVGVRMSVGRSLLSLMNLVARRKWAGAPHPGFEYDVWEAALGEGEFLGPDEAGVDVVVTASDLGTLARICGGWWTWEDGPVFVPLGEWKRRAALRAAGRDPNRGARTDDGAVTVPGGAARQE